MSLSTHVLDTARGRPAAGVEVTLERRDDDEWVQMVWAVTDNDGRIGDLAASSEMAPGVHRLTFQTGTWAAASGSESFFPEVAISFTVTDPDEHYHVPLLVSPYGYSTYRGS